MITLLVFINILQLIVYIFDVVNRNYKKELIHKFTFKDPITFNYNECPLRSFSN